MHRPGQFIEQGLSHLGTQVLQTGGSVGLPTLTVSFPGWAGVDGEEQSSQTGEPTQQC